MIWCSNCDYISRYNEGVGTLQVYYNMLALLHSTGNAESHLGCGCNCKHIHQWVRWVFLLILCSPSLDINR